MTFNRRTGIDPEIYYAEPIAWLKKCKKSGKEITREDLHLVIMKSLNVAYPQHVVRRLIELGYISEEKKRVIKVLI